MTAIMKKDSMRVLGELKGKDSRVMLIHYKDLNLAQFSDVTPYLSDDTEGLFEALEWFGVMEEDVAIIAHCHWPRGNKRQLSTLGMTAYHPFLVRYKGKTQIWAFAIPTVVNVNWLIGTHLGYPQCCVNEYLRDLKASVTDGESPLNEKRWHLREHHTTVAGGNVPCWDCMDKALPNTDAFRSRLLNIMSHSKGFEHAQGGNHLMFFDAVNTYLAHNLAPWTMFGDLKTKALV